MGQDLDRLGAESGPGQVILDEAAWHEEEIHPGGEQAEPARGDVVQRESRAFEAVAPAVHEQAPVLTAPQAALARLAPAVDVAENGTGQAIVVTGHDHRKTRVAAGEEVEGRNGWRSWTWAQSGRSRR